MIGQIDYSEGSINMTRTVSDPNHWQSSRRATYLLAVGRVFDFLLDDDSLSFIYRGALRDSCTWTQAEEGKNGLLYLATFREKAALKFESSSSNNPSSSQTTRVLSIRTQISLTQRRAQVKILYCTRI